MIDSSPAPLVEIGRFPSPAPRNQSLAYDGERLWVGSWETQRLYALDPRSGRIEQEYGVPGKPVGATSGPDGLRFVLSEGDQDDRYIRRFVGAGFTSEAVRCPDDTGSFLTHDGRRFWLSQRYNKRLIELDRAWSPVRALEVGEEVVGLAAVGERLYVSVWRGRERGGCQIGYVVPGDAPSGPLALRLLARSPFVAISLALDGERLWTNDFRGRAVVAFAVPR